MQCSPWQLISVANMLCLYIGITFLSLSRHTHPCMIYPCYVGFLVGSMLGSGVISNDWQYYDENEGLLWTIDFRFYCSARPGIEVASHDPLCNYTDVYLLVNLPQIYLLFLSGNLYAKSKSSKSSEVAKRITSGRIGNGCER